MPIYKATLRLKLTLWILVIFTVVFFVLLVVTWNLHRRAGREVLDGRLHSLAEGVADALRDAEPRLLAVGLDSFQPVDRTFTILAVCDESGDVLAARRSLEHEALPPLPQGNVAPQVRFVSLEAAQAQRLLGRSIQTRLVTYRYRLPDGRARFLHLVSTADHGLEERAFLYDVLLIGAVGAVIASVIASWVVAGWAVAPLKQLGEAARQIKPERVETRIDVESSDPEVRRLQSELNEALSRLEEGYRAQERFISNVAHDLKTPIAVMLTESQVLRPASASLEEIEAYRDSVVGEMQRLGGLVESFLTLARADQGDVLARMTEVAINDVIVEAGAECDPDAAQQEVRLVINLDPAAVDVGAMLRGDPDLLRTMLVNLIRNALRYSPAGAAVDVSSLLSDGKIRICVRDRGPGIPDEYLSRIFERFVQVPGGQARAGSMGLGLAIAESVAMLHDGTIGVHNCEDLGCEFTVELPIRHSSHGKMVSTASDDSVRNEA